MDKKGIFSDEMLVDAVKKGIISGETPIVACVDSPIIGPSSIDLTLGKRIYEVTGSATPRKGEKVEDMLSIIHTESGLEEIDLDNDDVHELSRGAVYIAELNESLNLAENMRARASPKSSIGRLNVFVRVLADGVEQFDTIPAGYNGKLYLEIYTSRFKIKVKKGISLTQLRLHSNHDIGDFTLRYDELNKLTSVPPHLLVDSRGEPLKDYGRVVTDDGLFLTVDLDSDVVAYRARETGKPIDLTKIDFYRAEDFWEIETFPNKEIVGIGTSDFYIMKSKEHLVVPHEYAVEIVPHNERLVEARIHYAGFAHPGFGYTSEGVPRGTPLIFEITPRETPIALRDGKPIAKLYYNLMQEKPKLPYNVRTTKYNTQALKLPPCFKQFEL